MDHGAAGIRGGAPPPGWFDSAGRVFMAWMIIIHSLNAYPKPEAPAEIARRAHRSTSLHETKGIALFCAPSGRPEACILLTDQGAVVGDAAARPTVDKPVTSPSIRSLGQMNFPRECSPDGG